MYLYDCIDYYIITAQYVLVHHTRLYIHSFLYYDQITGLRLDVF